MEKLLTSPFLNSALFVAFITLAFSAIGLLIRHLWNNRKPKIKIELRFCIENGDKGLSLTVRNFSNKKIKVESVGYDLFGNGSTNGVGVLLKNQTLEPKSSIKEFIHESNLNRDLIKQATKVFLKDELNNVWYAPKSEVEPLKNLELILKQYQ